MVAFVEADHSLRIDAVESDGEETFLGKPCRVGESDFSVIFRVTHQAAATSAQALEPRQTLGDQRFANALVLVFRQDRDRQDPGDHHRE